MGGPLRLKHFKMLWNYWFPQVVAKNLHTVGFYTLFKGEENFDHFQILCVLKGKFTALWSEHPTH